MTHEVHFPPCIHDPPHPLHPPPLDKPLRINAFAPLSAIEKLFPDLTWDLTPRIAGEKRFQQCGLLLATLVHRKIYGSEPQTQDDLVLRHELIGRTNPNKPPDDVIYRGKVEGMDTYDITFDHRVPSDDPNPETLQIVIFETEYDDAAFANNFCRMQIDPKDYAPYQNRLFATYRCCDKLSLKESRYDEDRRRINDDVKMWETPLKDRDAAWWAEMGGVLEEVSFPYYNLKITYHYDRRDGGAKFQAATFGRIE